MIREIGKIIKISKYVEVEEVVTKEQITAVAINIDNKILNATIVLLNQNNQIVDERLVDISGDNYDLLFSTDVIFEEGKQEGSYRESDLWKIIDRVSAQQE